VIEFPALHTGDLDAAGVRALVADLETHAERLQVVPKAAARRHVLPETLPLQAAAESLLAGELRGVQVRYVHEGQEWWDTLLALGDSYRIVRVAQGAA
jgi:hypothetical protein